MKIKTFVLGAAGVVAAAGIAAGIVVVASGPGREPVEVASPTDMASSSASASAEPTSRGAEETVLDEETQRRTVERAVKAMTFYARPMVDADTWTADLSPLLTPEAADALEGTDPSRVPVRTVFGGDLAPGATDTEAAVAVHTSGSDYTVTLTRDSAEAPWLVAELAPTAGVK